MDDSRYFVVTANRGLALSRRQSEQAGTSFHQDTPPNIFARDRGSWQVSWLAGPCHRPPSRDPKIPVALLVAGSPLTVAGAAAALRI